MSTEVDDRDEASPSNVVPIHRAPRRGPSGVEAGDWMSLLRRSGHGAIKATLRNICTILEHDPGWKSAFALNQMTGLVELRGSPMIDDDFTALRVEIEEQYGFEPSEKHTFAAVSRRARVAAHHPVRAYLDGCVWDRRSRFGDLTTLVLGADPFYAPILRMWFIGAVARVMTPGCKMDVMLVLQGRQGAKKSTFLEALAGKWHLDTPPDLRSKDAFLTVNAGWIVEFAELQGMVGVTWQRLKSFVSSPYDTFRPPYGRSVMRVPRTCVFAATTNDTAFLSDPTGSRRFWPLPVGPSINIELAREMRDQLWAEARVAFLDGERWWLDEDDPLSVEVRERAEAFADEDVWTQQILEYAMRQGKAGVSIAEVLLLALGIEVGKHNQRDQNRVADVLRKAGFSRSPNAVRGDRGRSRRWYPPPADGGGE